MHFHKCLACTSWGKFCELPIRQPVFFFLDCVCKSIFSLYCTSYSPVQCPVTTVTISTVKSTYHKVMTWDQYISRGKRNSKKKGWSYNLSNIHQHVFADEAQRVLFLSYRVLLYAPLARSPQSFVFRAGRPILLKFLFVVCRKREVPPGGNSGQENCNAAVLNFWNHWLYWVSEKTRLSI